MMTRRRECDLHVSFEACVKRNYLVKDEEELQEFWKTDSLTEKDCGVLQDCMGQVIVCER